MKAATNKLNKFSREINLFDLENAGFQEIPHTADWAYQVWATKLEDLFKAAASGLYYLAGMALAQAPVSRYQIALAAIDAESLLVAWLNELLYLHEANNIGIASIEALRLQYPNPSEVLAQSPTENVLLRANIQAQPVVQWHKDIKAVTYSNLSITKAERGFETTLVLDV